MALRAVPDHPKFAHLKSLLKMPKAVVLGYLECVWHFTGRFTPQGNIGKYSDLAIESWLEWDGEEGKLIEALMKSGWIDPDETHRFLVHDWSQHADKATRMALKRANLDFLAPGVPTPYPQSGNTVPETESAVSTVWGLPVPVPVPVPVENTPHPRARDAEPETETPPESDLAEDEIPPGLSVLAYARGMLEILAIPLVMATEQAAAAAIGALRKERGGIAAHIATGELTRHARDALARGETVDKWWFTDAKWRRKEGGSGAKSTRFRSKTDGNLEALRESLGSFDQDSLDGSGDGAAGDSERGGPEPLRQTPVVLPPERRGGSAGANFP